MNHDTNGDLAAPATPEMPAEREDIQEMSSAVESLMFASSEPLTLGDLRRMLAIRPATLERVLDYLGRSLSEAKRGIRLQRHQDWARLVTAPENALYIDKMRGQQAGQRLSEAALETLALIAYRQPVTRPQIEAIRGVDCSGVVNTLLARGLVAEVGRLETVGHPILYGTTLAFLQHFGLERPDQLPPIDDIKERAVALNTTQAGEMPGSGAALQTLKAPEAEETASED